MENVPDTVLAKKFLTILTVLLYSINARYGVYMIVLNHF